MLVQDELLVLDESGNQPRPTWQPPSLTSLGPVPERPVLRLYRVRPTAAFSRRDALLPGFGDAEAAVRALGYAPAMRTVGGRMAPLHEDTLIIDLMAARSAPQLSIHRRFDVVTEAISTGLRRLGVPAQVGEVPGEYCPGEFSVNAAGWVKLAGVAQRITRWGFLISTVLVVDRAEPLAEVVAAGYRALGLPVDPSVTGAVTTYAPGVRRTEVAEAVITSLAGRVRELLVD